MLEYLTLIYFSTISIFLIINDIKYLILPDKYLIILIFGLLSFDLIFCREKIVFNFFSGLIGGLFFLMIHLITKQKLGLGDVKLSFVIGYFLNINYWIVAIFISCICGIIIYLIGFKFWNWNKTTKIPFGPFMIIATILTKLGSLFL